MIFERGGGGGGQIFSRVSVFRYNVEVRIKELWKKRPKKDFSFKQSF